MGFRFRKKIKIAPGISLNVGKNGITSATIGKRGASLNIGKKGTKATIGLPGTGLSWTSDVSGGGGGSTIPKDAFIGLVIPSSEFMDAPYHFRKAWYKGSGKVHFDWKYKFFHLAGWFLAALPFIHYVPGLSVILAATGIIRFIWKQPAVNYSISYHLNDYR